RNLGLDTGIELVLVEGSTNVKNLELHQADIPTDFLLSQNYPNPFNPDTKIQYQLCKPSHITLDIFQVNGQQIRTLYNGYQEAGIHVQVWDGRLLNGNPAPSGVYMYRISVQTDEGTIQQVRKMVLNR
ncbi:T9SS C-terminal target domain-containing protein, partial [candidate division KSB1 bacterium]